MANIILNKIIASEINIDNFKEWLLFASHAQYFRDITSSCNCSQAEFLTYFVNFIHEEISRQIKFDDTSQNSTFKQIEPVICKENITIKKTNLYSIADHNKSASFPLTVNETGQNSIEIALDTTSNASTPKMLETQIDSDVNKSYCSPISPLYKTHAGFSTPKNKRENRIVKLTEKASPICLGDFIITKPNSSKKKSRSQISAKVSLNESTKRITPTCFSQVKANGSFQESTNSFNNFDTKEVSLDSFNGSRNFLASERLKILTMKTSRENLMSHAPNRNSTSQKIEIKADVMSVSYKKEINNIVEIYVMILNNNLILNINSEMYFLISLLFNKQIVDKSDEDFNMGVDFLNEDMKLCFQSKNVTDCSHYFKTIHNVVYFAVKCLETQVGVLKHYDKSTLKLLSLNEMLNMFSVTFADELKHISEEKPDRILGIFDLTQTNVCFILDTDNRNNFPNDITFHAFRKQRDLFYEILRIWENNHLLPGWAFSASLSGKIKSLFSLQSEPVNFMHFSRLFKTQLLATCGKSQKEEGIHENQVPFFSSLPNVDADKLNRLKNRLITKQQTSGGLNSLPSFPGHQEFYRDFIVVAANHVFNKHLCDSLILQIFELNNAKSISTEFEESDANVNESTRKCYAHYLRQLIVLTKFLGFIESLAYKSESNSYSVNLLHTQVRVRQQTIPSFDVKQALIMAIQEKTIILTIPWITNYLSMLDFVTLRLPYYISVYKLLFEVYRSYDVKLKRFYDYNAMLVKFSLGWLFELSHFPYSEYFNFFLGDKIKQKIINSTATVGLDDLNIVDQNILYDCCPFLDEIRKLVMTSALSNTLTVKHITPVTASQSSEEITKKKLELQLEESLFNGQPISVRKTVDFVSERIASSCVKHVCNVIVPCLKKNASEELQSFLESWRENSQKANLKIKVNQMAEANLVALHDHCNKEISIIMKEKIPPAIDSLLAVDTLPQTKRTCVAIAAKICKDRLKQWMASQVNISIFSKDFDTEVHKILSQNNSKKKLNKPVFALPPGGKQIEHNDNCPSAFYSLEKIKNLSLDVMATYSVRIDREVVLNILNETYTCLSERCDVNQTITSYICALLVDLSLLLIIHKPDIILDAQISAALIKIWNCYYGETEVLFKNLLCPRNIRLFAEAQNEDVAWDNLAKFIGSLINGNVISCDNIQCQCIVFRRQQLDKVIVKNFLVFVSGLSKYFKGNGGENENSGLF